jgi:tripartite-type tricarboxylate transporter receptor subunit TctC
MTDETTSPGLRRRGILRATALALAAPALLSRGAAAQAAYPDHPVRIIVPLAPGGATDLVSRLIAQELRAQLGQTVIIDNRPGAGTVIAATALAKAPPDGYTLMITTNTHVTHPHLMQDLAYDGLKSFTPVARLGTADYLLFVNETVPAKNLAEFIGFVRANPNAVNFGTHGMGGFAHIAAEMLQMQADIKMQLVHYKGAAPAMMDVLGNQVQAYFDVPSTAMPYVLSGKLKAIGAGGSQRLPTLPEIPTLKESGLPDFDVSIWYGLLAPAGLQPAVVTRLNEALAKLLAQPAVKAQLASLAVQPMMLESAPFGVLMKSEYEKYGAVIRAANIRME